MVSFIVRVPNGMGLNHMNSLSRNGGKAEYILPSNKSCFGQSLVHHVALFIQDEIFLLHIFYSKLGILVVHMLNSKFRTITITLL